MYCQKHKVEKVKIWPSDEEICIKCAVEEIREEYNRTSPQIRPAVRIPNEPFK